MSTWVLIIFFVAISFGHPSSGVDVEKVEGFSSEAACTKALKALPRELHNSSITAVCVPKK